MRRAEFLDRDGVINEKAPEGESVTRWEHFSFLPGVAEGNVLLNRANYRVLVGTNQRCTAKGLATREEVENLHRKMVDAFAGAGAQLDAVYYCPHDLGQACSCRKPAPGMLLEAAREYQIDLRESWMVGDSKSDIEAVKNAGCRTARLLAQAAANETDQNCSRVGVSANVVTTSLLRAITQILELPKGTLLSDTNTNPERCFI